MDKEKFIKGIILISLVLDGIVLGIRIARLGENKEDPALILKKSVWSTLCLSLVLYSFRLAT